MGKFSNYIDNINQQTELLRENLTDASGIDCSKMSIGNCAEVLSQYVPDEVADEKLTGYERPDWYPNIKEILNNAPLLEKDGTTYYPMYIMLLLNNENQSPFYRIADTSNTSAVNWRRNTGGNAVLCSDRCNNILEANSNMLEIGTEIIYNWDKTKDIVNKDSDYGVRWVIVYNSALKNGVPNINTNTYCYGTCPIIELVTGKMVISSGSFDGSSTYTAKSPLKYVEITEDTDWNGLQTSCFNYLPELEEVNYFPKNWCTYGKTLSYNPKLKIIRLKNMTSVSSTPTQNTIEGNDALHTIEWLGDFTGNFYFKVSMYNLKKLILPNFTKTASSNSTIANCYSLKNISIPDTVVSVLDGYLSNCYGLKNVKIGNGLQTVGNSFLYNAYNLESLILPNKMAEIGSSFCARCTSLKNIILPEEIGSLNLAGFLSQCNNLKYVKFPLQINNIVNISSTNYLDGVEYIELYNDFDISNLNFTGKVLKTREWYKNLCIWLKDKTGESPNNMILGEGNLFWMKQIWLTFNPNDKRDITWVDAGTEGAINVVQFITEQLNWTLS